MGKQSPEGNADTNRVFAALLRGNFFGATGTFLCNLSYFVSTRRNLLSFGPVVQGHSVFQYLAPGPSFFYLSLLGFRARSWSVRCTWRAAGLALSLIPFPGHPTSHRCQNFLLKAATFITFSLSLQFLKQQVEDEDNDLSQNQRDKCVAIPKKYFQNAAFPVIFLIAF